jgi:accessory gene regulator B
MSYLGFSTKWAASLAKIHHLNEEKQTELTYAIEVVTLNSMNVLMTLALGWALGVCGETAATLLTMAGFRHTAGGGHSESPWRCALVTITIFPLLALAARSVSTWPPYYISLLSLGAILFGFACIFLYAPADNPKAPIVSPVKRQKLKRAAILIMSIISIITIALLFGSRGNTPMICMCLVLSTLWASFNLTPWGHHLWHFIDKIGSSSERRCMK